MSVDFEKRESLRILEGLENGTMSTADAYNALEKRDPLVVYFIIRYLREKYPASNSSSAGVNGRLVELTSTYSNIVATAKKGEKDPIREWFDDTYGLGEFYSKAGELIDLIIEKIES